MTGHRSQALPVPSEAIAGIMAMQHSLVPPTINHFTDDPVFDTA